jgi:hypothetical protein
LDISFSVDKIWRQVCYCCVVVKKSHTSPLVILQLSKELRPAKDL